MTQKSTNPVASDAVAEHRIAILACGYDIVLVLVYDRREVDMRHGSRVPMASERHHLGRFGHCIVEQTAL